MYKLVVSNFYGTLIDHNESIPISTMLEIDRIRKAGVLFCIATSQILKTVLDYNRSFPFLDYIIALNGAYIYDVNHEKVIYKKVLKPSMIKKIYSLFSSFPIYFCTDSKRILVDDFSSIYQNEKQNIYKIEIHVTKKKEGEEILRKLKEVELDICSYLQSYENHFFIEIFSQDIDKFLGVEKICKLGRFSLDSVVAIGSSSTDVKMIGKVGYGVAVDNACAAVKKKAKEITSSNDCKGIEKIIRKYF